MNPSIHIMLNWKLQKYKFLKYITLCYAYKSKWTNLKLLEYNYSYKAYYRVSEKNNKFLLNIIGGMGNAHTHTHIYI